MVTDNVIPLRKVKAVISLHYLKPQKQVTIGTPQAPFTPSVSADIE